MIIAPFWGRTDHVGVYRVERFLRWLEAAGYFVIIICSGKRDLVLAQSWGKTIVIKDSISIVTNFLISSAKKIRTKLFLYIWNTLIMIFLPPDEARLWAGRVAKSKLIKDELNNCKLIISSSPPHSSHLAAYQLSLKKKLSVIVDLRDGWMDEPLKPILSRSKIRNRIESKIEKKVLNNADQIFVTSNEWKILLKSRLKETEKKTCLLTNAYPVIQQQGESEKYEKKSKNLKLIYAGRFTGSSYLRTINMLLEPIYLALLNSYKSVQIEILGDLKRNDKYHFKSWQMKFEEISSSITVHARVERNEMLRKISDADGLLLLSISHSALPSKLYEYIYTKKPILAVTLKNSAVWNLAVKLPQMFLYSYNAQIEDNTVVTKFFDACYTCEYDYKVPSEFSESHLSDVFLNEITNTLRTKHENE